MNKKQEYEKKLEILRELYRNATGEDRKLIEIRGKIIKRLLEKIKTASKFPS